MLRESGPACTISKTTRHNRLPQPGISLGFTTVMAGWSTLPQTSSPTAGKGSLST